MASGVASWTAAVGSAALFCVLLCFAAEGKEPMLVPRIASEWWTVASDPDLGELTSPQQQPVDFAIWQAADGSWQLWSCIRHTKCGGQTRLFYRWQGKALTDSNWGPVGIAMEADPRYGETPGGLQAPFVLETEGVYHMFYGDWENICLATGTDGKTFTRSLNAEKRAGLFSQGPGSNTRDPMVLRRGEVHYCYYTAHPDLRGAVYARTSRDLRSWSEGRQVAFGGSAGTGPSSAECPFVVCHEPSEYYYLFRTQRYGSDAQTSVYRSRDPLDFGADNDKEHLVCTLPVAAPEIIEHGGEFYLAALRPDLKGIQIARLEWVEHRRKG
jgi:hypothetical protein